MFQPQEYFWIFLFPAFESTHQQSHFLSDTWAMWVSVNTTFLTLITIRIVRVLSAFAIDFPLYCPFLESQGSSFFNFLKNLKFPTFLYIWGFLDFFSLFFYLIYFCPHHMACGTLVPLPGIKPMPAALGAGSLNHWITRKVPWSIRVSEKVDFQSS